LVSIKILFSHEILPAIVVKTVPLAVPIASSRVKFVSHFISTQSKLPAFTETVFELLYLFVPGIIPYQVSSSEKTDFLDDIFGNSN